MMRDWHGLIDQVQQITNPSEVLGQIDKLVLSALQDTRYVMCVFLLVCISYALAIICILYALAAILTRSVIGARPGHT